VSAVYVRYSTTLDAHANAALHAFARRLLAAPPHGVRDIYPGLGTIYVEWEDARISAGAVEQWLRDVFAQPADDRFPPRRIEIPTRYDGEDIDVVAAATARSRDEVAAAHSARTYRVFAVGAAPGQPFLGVNDEAIRLPRRGTPRVVVPAHSVAIAGQSTTVYPVAMPGGWHVIGRAAVASYDPRRAEPFLLRPGDEVRFAPGDHEPVTPLEPLDLFGGGRAGHGLRVDHAGPLDLVLDAGRFNQAHLGMAQSGPIDASAARLANALVGNPPGAALLETTLGGPTLTALAPVVVAITGAGAALEINGHLVAGSPVPVRGGATIRVRGRDAGARGYLAIAGGIASSAFLGSASVDLRGGVGRPLRAGDVLEPARDPGVPRRWESAPAAPRGPIRLLAGPQHTPEATRALSAGSFTVGAADRMGVRLVGPPVPGGELLSESPPLGAVQVTGDGTPIVLLNDRQRSAGYAKPAVVHPGDLARVAQLRPGAPVEFSFVEAPPPRWYIDVHELTTERATWT
jgi:KipI family sensor histidine kinase inhibitor